MTKIKKKKKPMKTVVTNILNINGDTFCTLFPDKTEKDIMPYLEKNAIVGDAIPPGVIRHIILDDEAVSWLKERGMGVNPTREQLELYCESLSNADTERLWKKEERHASELTMFFIPVEFSFYHRPSKGVLSTPQELISFLQQQIANHFSRIHVKKEDIFVGDIVPQSSFVAYANTFADNLLAYTSGESDSYIVDAPKAVLKPIDLENEEESFRFVEKSCFIPVCIKSDERPLTTLKELFERRIPSTFILGTTFEKT